MMQFLLIAIAVGGVVGAAVGFKVGQSYERMRPRSAKKKGPRP
jgi:membrane protein DedA with SNARE-associated domain